MRLCREGTAFPNGALYLPMTSLTTNWARFSRLVGQVGASLGPVAFLAAPEARCQRLTSPGPVLGVLRPLSCRP